MPEAYARQITLIPNVGVDPRLAVIDCLREWVGPRWPSGRPWFTVEESDGFKATDGSVFRWEPFVGGEQSLLEFTWRHPHADNLAISWSTQVAFYGCGPAYSLILRVSNTGPEVGLPGTLLTTRPRLLLSLVKHFTLQCDGFRAHSSPEILAVSSIQSFVRYCVFDHTRRYPILVLSPDANGNYSVSPEQLAREFLTLAQPFVIDTPTTTYALTQEIGVQSLSCFNGALRVYMPGVRKSSNPLDHPLLFSNRVSQSSSRLGLAKFLSLNSAESFTPDPHFHSLRDDRVLAGEEKRKKLLASLESYKTVDADVRTWRELAEEYERNNRELLAQNVALQEDLQEAGEKLAAARFALSQRTLKGGAAQEQFVATSVFEATEMAQALFDKSLLVLESALSAAEDSPFVRPDEVWTTLARLAELSERRMEGPLGKSIRDFLAEYGVDYRVGISETTSKQVRKQYRFFQDGVAYVCEEHVCLGSASYDPGTCLRIYLSTKHEGEPRIVIGHVGRHLDVVTTN